jgi:hypothetical protein
LIAVMVSEEYALDVCDAEFSKCVAHLAITAVDQPCSVAIAYDADVDDAVMNEQIWLQLAIGSHLASPVVVFRV